MATVYVTYSVAERVKAGAGAFVLKGNYAQSEAITSSGTSVQGAIVFRGPHGVTKVQSPDQAIAVVTGANPTATLAGGIFIPAGGYEYISVEAGERIAVIDV